MAGAWANMWAGLLPMYFWCHKRDVCHNNCFVMAQKAVLSEAADGIGMLMSPHKTNPDVHNFCTLLSGHTTDL